MPCDALFRPRVGGGCLCLPGRRLRFGKQCEFGCPAGLAREAGTFVGLRFARTPSRLAGRGRAAAAQIGSIDPTAVPLLRRERATPPATPPLTADPQPRPDPQADTRA